MLAMPDGLLETTTLLQTWFSSLWWLWLFIVLVVLAKSVWTTYIQEHYKRSIKYVMFELRVPREVRRSPRAMEQVFMTLHGIRNSPSNLKEKWWEGEVTMWFSCEIASLGGELHFFMRVPDKHRNIIEAALYAQYPDLEVEEVNEDYVNRFPKTYRELKKAGYEIFGNELILAKHDAYPIRTYIDFEDNEEDRQLDPISALLETIVKIKPQETIWIQILVQPVDDSWKKECEKLVDDFRERTGRTQVETKAATGSTQMVWVERTPGQLETLKAIERCIAKPGFNTLIRYMYIAPKEILSEGFARRGVISAFNQYASESLNKFKHNAKAWTRTSFWYWPHIFPKSRTLARKNRIYESYRKRKIREHLFFAKLLELDVFDWGFAGQKSSTRVVLNAEELATIYHPPMVVVLTGPLIKRAEAKKAGPPAGLPIYGEEGEGKDLPGI